MTKALDVTLDYAAWLIIRLSMTKAYQRTCALLLRVMG